MSVIKDYIISFNNTIVKKNFEVNMNKKFRFIILFAVFGIFISSCEKTPSPTEYTDLDQSGTRLFKPGVTMNYGDISLSGGFQAGNFPELWDLTQGDLEISFTYDANGLVDDFGGGAHAWAELGIRAVGYGNFNPTWMAEGAGVWLATDYDWTANTFDPDPPGSQALDLDDKLILQKGGGNGEGSYNLPSTPPNPWANHGVWFDRDGVDQWQAQMWGAIDGVTYNTSGFYDIVIKLHANDGNSGTAYMTVNGRDQGFYVPNWHSGPPDLTPAGMTFTGDMTQMQVFYGIYGYGATHSVKFENINVTGSTRNIIIDGCDTGVEDRVYEGKTITSLIYACADGAKNHGKFVSCVASLTNKLKKEGIINGSEKDAIQNCAAGSSLP